jgi:hypothetical protein
MSEGWMVGLGLATGVAGALMVRSLRPGLRAADSVAHAVTIEVERLLSLDFVVRSRVGAPIRADNPVLGFVWRAPIVGRALSVPKGALVIEGGFAFRGKDGRRALATLQAFSPRETRLTNGALRSALHAVGLGTRGAPEEGANPVFAETVHCGTWLANEHPAWSVTRLTVHIPTEEPANVGAAWGEGERDGWVAGELWADGELEATQRTGVLYERITLLPGTLRDRQRNAQE